MSESLRVTVEFDAPENCPIVDVSRRTTVEPGSVSTTVSPDGDGERITEFSVADAEPDDEKSTRTVSDAPEMTRIFSDGDVHRYRFTHDDEECPCECLGRLGYPIERYHPEDGTLTLVFYATSDDELRAVLDELSDRFPDADVTRFLRSSTNDGVRDDVSVDRNKLTARQREVLDLAYQRGYFDRPRRTNATEIADELDITPSTFREHLTAAEQKIFRDLL